MCSSTREGPRCVGLTPAKLLQAAESDTLQTDTAEVSAAKKAGRGAGTHDRGPNLIFRVREDFLE